VDEPTRPEDDNALKPGVCESLNTPQSSNSRKQHHNVEILPICHSKLTSEGASENFQIRTPAVTPLMALDDINVFQVPLAVQPYPPLPSALLLIFSPFD
jgi:hypothetical protein